MCSYFLMGRIHSIFLATSAGLILLSPSPFSSSTMTFKQEYISLAFSFGSISNVLSLCMTRWKHSSRSLLDPLWSAQSSVHSSWAHKDHFETSLGKGPDAPRRVWCVCPVPNPRHSARWLNSSIHRTRQQSHCGVRCLCSVLLLNQYFIESWTFQMKFDSLDLRTFSELSSARFIKCAPHLNLKPCLGQATCLMPPLIVRLKEKQSPKLL